MFLAFLPLLGSMAAPAWSLSVSEKAALQAAMQVHIDEQTVDGVYLYLDRKDGEIRFVHPVKAHSMILTMGRYYVLCADFRDDKGKDVNIDFYMARKGRSYVIVHVAVADRAFLDGLMSAGKVRQAD
ncbi:MAG: hypothetical protein EXQ95_08350 [Alphaproteobacteria bacterium]|nr:hypothetical protein [Alphaproteobacteria bacterium]